MKIKKDHFDINQIMRSGQCFRIKEISENTYSVVYKDNLLLIKKEEDSYDFLCSEDEFEKTWKDYFDFNTDYNEVEKMVKAANDPHLSEAFSLGSGIRILKQDLFETIVSFLISQNNNIPRIKKSIDLISKRFGKKVSSYDGSTFEYTFPEPKEVDSDIFLKENFGLGYRNLYLKEIYDYVKDNPNWLSYLKTLSYEDARKELLKRKGIGPKVADCICLFSLHHVDAFPIDTHVKDLLNKYYGGKFNVDAFKGKAGIIQQYLFYYEIK